MPTDDESADSGSPPAAEVRAVPPRTSRNRPKSRVVLGSLAVFAAVVLVAGSLTAYLKYRSVWDSIDRVDVSGDLHKARRPPVDPNAENILLIGSDTRVGVNGKIGGSAGIGGARSDTIILVHIAPGA
ncbi:MAG: LytR family transcriptional regulator, partial [Actinobacteria bacterium]|nr:LytR family transcriptional regulator [Actinomycetota bacterium]